MKRAPASDNYPEIREAIAKLYARFPGGHWRDLGRQMAYPAAFVRALTEAGHLCVLILEKDWHLRRKGQLPFCDALGGSNASTPLRH